MIERCRTGASVWLVLVAACGAKSETCGASQGVVARVRDGDTIVMDDGEVIRYIGVNAPEVEECYGDVASSVNATMVVGAAADLVDDARCEDIYERRLAYVIVDGVDVGAWLLAHGYARLDIIPPDVARADAYRGVVAEAEANRVGLWSACP